MDKGIKPGRYRHWGTHYKGNDYIVYATVRHSGTEQVLVVYRTDYPDGSGENTHWVRPLTMFVETVEIESRVIRRFQWIADQ